MQTLKKLWLGLAATFFLLFLAITLWPMPKASAIDGFSRSQVKNSLFTFKDINTVGMSINSQTIAVTPTTPSNQNPNGGSTDSCAGLSDSAGGSSLNWIICPLVAGLSSVANDANSFVEGQLNVNIQQNFGLEPIKTVWTVFKDIVSVLLVIILLVMVISQAIGGTVFDAYTVRKLLPKLAVAIIAMQLSWDICLWLVGLFNDAGQGIGDLMAAPFGGQSALDLPALLHSLNTAYAIGVGWIPIFVGAIALVWAWPMVVIAAFTMLMSTIAAFATLLVRNIIIIVGVIVAPLALLAWVLPRTQSFWKYWYSNFSKALMLFPLTVMIIIGGRIFAWVVAQRGGTPGPIDLVMILVGFFGPYFFLPKVFKFGGSILRGANTTLERWQKSAADKAKPGLKQFMHDVYTGKKAEAYDPRKKAWEVGGGMKKIEKAPRGFKWLNGRKRPTVELGGRGWRRLQSGHFLPTNRSRNLTLKTGEEWSSARTAEALSYEQKWERLHAGNGISEKEAEEWNQKATEYARKQGIAVPPGGLKLFSQKDPGSAAGKWSALALFWQAHEKGDDALMKAVGDRLIDSKSFLEFRDRNFVAPDTNKETGHNMLMPMFAHSRVVDREYKDPARYAGMGQGGGDFPYHNTPSSKGYETGEGYGGVYIRGVRWLKGQRTRPDGTEEEYEYENPDYNPDVRRSFGIDIGETRAEAVDPDWARARFKEGLHFTPKMVAAHYAQAAYDDAVNNIAQGGSNAGAFMTALITGAQKGFIEGEAADAMPIKQAVWAVVNATRRADGRSKLSTIYTDPSTKEIANNMFRASGITKFKDEFGTEHDLTVDELWAANTAAEEKMKNPHVPDEDKVRVAVRREQSLGHAANPATGEGFVAEYTEPPTVGGGGHPDDDYWNPDTRRWEPLAPTAPTAYATAASPAAASAAAPATAPATATASAPAPQGASGTFHSGAAEQAPAAGQGSVMFDRRLQELQASMEDLAAAQHQLGRDFRTATERLGQTPPTGPRPSGAPQTNDDQENEGDNGNS